MRSRRLRNSGWFSQHALPFLSIMLGLIAVMALANIGLTATKRQEVRKQQYVQVANIPPNLIPIHIICDHEGFRWYRDGAWHTVRIGEALASSEAMGDGATDFLHFIADTAASNRTLSYARKQNTIILWIRPKGILSAAVLEGIIYQAELPIRIGKLPLLEDEEVKLK